MDTLTEGLQRLGYQFVPFLLAVIGHEVGHGAMANYWGDPTAKERGRLTLNPVPHLDLVGTLVIPIVTMVSGVNLLFGWAKPVPIDPRRFRKFRPGLFWTAFAGPLANFICAFICAFTLCLMLRFLPDTTPLLKEIATMLEYGVFINYGLGFFNLLPLPPLDGSKIIESVLPYSAIQKYEQMSRFGIIILLLLMFTGAIRYLSGPITFLAMETLQIASWATGVPLS